MTATLALTLAFGSLLALSCGQFPTGEEDLMRLPEMASGATSQPMGSDMDDIDSDESIDESGGPKGVAQVANNIAFVLEKLLFVVVNDQRARKKLKKALQNGKKCILKAKGLDDRYVKQFVLAIPAGIDCVKETLHAKNQKQQMKAVNCFKKRFSNFQKLTKMPRQQLMKLKQVIVCLQKTFLGKGRMSDMSDMSDY